MKELEQRKALTVMSLCERHDWLVNKTDKLMNLIDECQNEEEVRLVEELLDRFLIIKEKERDEAYDAMADYINSVVQDGNSLIVAMTRGSSPDSGQKVVSELRTFLAYRGLRKIYKLNRFDYLSRKRFKDFDNFIIVDEFVGSGKTIRNRIQDLRNMFPKANIHFCMMAGMEANISDIQKDMESNEHIFCHYKLKKGIFGHYIGSELIDKTMTMVRLERRLDSVVGKKDIYEYSFGYGNAQSLVGFGQYNIPNSVFPIFWWPNRDFGRLTLFIRDEDGFE